MKNESQIYSRYFTYVKPLTRLPIIKTYGSTIFTLIITIIFILYAIKPTVETILVLQKKLADETLVLEKINQKVSDLSKARQNFEKLDPSLKLKIEAAIPETIQLRSVTQTLEQTALRNQASVSALQIQPLSVETNAASELNTVSEVVFTFNVEGEYQKLISVLQDLKSSGRLISIDNMSLSKLSEGPGLIMSISGKAYYLK